MVGQGSISVNQRREPVPPPGPPFTLNSAYNGTTVDPVTGQIQLGDDTFFLGTEPGTFVKDRYLNTNNFDLQINGTPTQTYFLLDPLGSMRLGDVNGTVGPGTGSLVLDFNTFQANLLTRSNGGHAALFMDALNNLIQLGDVNVANNGSTLILDDINRFLRFKDFVGGRYLNLDIFNDVYQIGDIDNVTGGSFIDLFNTNNAMRLYLRNNRALQFVQQVGNNRYEFGDLDATDQGAVLSLTADAGNSALQLSASGGRIAMDHNITAELFRVGGIGGFTNQIFLSIDASATNRIATNGFTELIGSNGTNYANNAAANVGTLNNAPAAGDPTKWIPINDNGTIRNIPAW